MELVTTVVTYEAGETRAEQMLVAPITNGDGTGSPDPARAVVCLPYGTATTLVDGRESRSYVYNPEDPRQVRAEEERKARATGDAGGCDSCGVNPGEAHAPNCGDSIDDARPGSV